MIEIDPAQFIIKRKRKLYKFALFANSPLCFELDEWEPRDIDVLELGAGTALFSVDMASKYPRRKFLAIDVKADRLQKGAHEAAVRRLTNVHFVRARADQLSEMIKPHSLKAIWITFPDPFPKKRAAGRRLTHLHFLKQYKKLLAPNGALYLKHDNKEFFEWSLEQLVADKWHIDELSHDLHDSDLKDDYKILTTYEQRWLGKGLKTYFVKVTKK